MMCNRVASCSSLIAGCEFALVGMRMLNNQVYDRDVNEPKL
jgi:hypothetical protein